MADKDLKARAKQLGVDEKDFEPAEEQPAVGSLKDADKAPGLPIQDAEAHDPPVRSNRPESELIASLAVGSGQHVPVTDPDVDPDGRYNPGWDEGETVTTTAVAAPETVAMPTPETGETTVKSPAKK